MSIRYTTFENEIGGRWTSVEVRADEVTIRPRFNMYTGMVAGAGMAALLGVQFLRSAAQLRGTAAIVPLMVGDACWFAAARFLLRALSLRSDVLRIREIDDGLDPPIGRIITPRDITELVVRPNLEDSRRHRRVCQLYTRLKPGDEVVLLTQNAMSRKQRVIDLGAGLAKRWRVGLIDATD